MRNEGIKRVHDARQSRGRSRMIRKAVRTILAGIMDILFVLAVGCWLGIGFGLGMSLLYTWII